MKQEIKLKDYLTTVIKESTQISLTEKDPLVKGVNDKYLQILINIDRICQTRNKY